MPERKVPGDFVEFLAALNAHGVEFLVVGGYAVYFHGHPRDTGDIDIVLRPNLENARRLVAAVAAFGAGALGYTAEDYLSKDFIQIGVSPVRIDITSAFDGVGTEKLWSERVAGRIGDVAVCFPSKECLLLNKRAAGRPKDLRDVEALEGPGL
ncbi:MAG: hypothetical protein HYZ75_07385 [Elusimicrobia bacterium]|nr:hypothetical protein [Elusimicrobiota bacterium]